MLIFFVINIFIASITSIQSEDWRLDKDKDEIKVFTRKVEGYPIREFKAESKISTDFDDIIELFEDVDNYPDWISDVTSSEIIEKTDDSTYYYRMVIKAPFPVSNRDLVSEMKFVREGENTLRIEMQAFPDLIDQVDGLIRIPFSTGYWEFVKDGNELVVYNQFLSDPGGSVPNWVINAFLTNNPYKTIRNLKKQLE